MFTEFNCATTIVDTIVTRLNPPQNQSLYYRFIFTATTDEAMTEAWRQAFYKFITGGVQALGGNLAGIGGSNQTIEMRVILKPTFSPDEFARRLKILSASWARRKADRPNFVWREDYEAITLDPTRQWRVTTAKKVKANV